MKMLEGSGSHLVALAGRALVAAPFVMSSANEVSSPGHHSELLFPLMSREQAEMHPPQYKVLGSQLCIDVLRPPVPAMWTMRTAL